MTALATVLIPAHNEASVIGRCLRPLRPACQAGLLRIIVIANGCTDDTAGQARATCPEALVLESGSAGKTAALNLGQTRAQPGLPVVVLDSDLEVAQSDILALVVPLRAGMALASSGVMALDLSQVSRPVAAFQRAWATNPYFARGKFGGLFALSPEGASRVFPLPEVTADDEFVRRHFSRAETAFVPACQFVAHPPRHLAGLLATRRRALRGTRELAALGLTDPSGGQSVRVMLRAALGRRGGLADLAVYAAVMLAVRILLAVEHPCAARRWERDLSSRLLPGGGS